MKFGKEEKPIVFVKLAYRLTDDQISQAFKGQFNTQWYKALQQKLDDLREENALNASRAASSNNALAMAGGLNVYEALTALIAEMAKLTGDDQSFQ